MTERERIEQIAAEAQARYAKYLEAPPPAFTYPPYDFNIRDIGAALAILFMVVVLGFGIYGAAHSGTPAYSAVVKLDIPGKGHGSGVHIGGGYILTAQHVVEAAGETALQVTTETGETVLVREVVWQDKEYDVALVRVGVAMRTLGSVPLSCGAADPKRGDNVRIEGNPGGLDFITVWGRVAKSGAIPRKDFWKAVLVLDITVQGGFSGGPLFSEAGELVGILVGGVIQPQGYSYYGVPLAYAVPRSAVCKVKAFRE